MRARSNSSATSFSSEAGRNGASSEDLGCASVPQYTLSDRVRFARRVASESGVFVSGSLLPFQEIEVPNARVIWGLLGRVHHYAGDNAGGDSERNHDDENVGRMCQEGGHERDRNRAEENGEPQNGPS
jgi:hypothetical protein